jgi:hypothetical protein
VNAAACSCAVCVMQRVASGAHMLDGIGPTWRALLTSRSTPALSPDVLYSE